MSRALLLAVFVCLSTTAAAEEKPTPFDQGKVSISGGIQLQTDVNDNFIVISVGAGYFIVKGLALELSTSAWLAHDPFVATITPGARYIFWQVPFLHPYIGSFFRYWYVDGFDDQQSVGGRLGVVSVQRPISINAGLVVERIVSACDDCTDVYPEFSLSFSF